MCKDSCRSLTVGEQVRAKLGTMSSREASRLRMDINAGRICDRTARDRIGISAVRRAGSGFRKRR